MRVSVVARLISFQLISAASVIICCAVGQAIFVLRLVTRINSALTHQSALAFIKGYMPLYVERLLYP